MPVALAFLDSRRAALDEGGARGVRWLADEIERHLDEDGPLADDHDFVEGAGALLALVLIEHLGGQACERDGAHGIRLGQFGWFDPFRAVDEALVSQDPRRRLAEQLDLAEREADGHGPISRLVGLFVRVLQDERPDLAVESQFELTVELSNGASVDLQRLEPMARSGDEGTAREAARRIVSMLPGSKRPKLTSWNEASSRILPRLISERFIRSLPLEQTLHAERLGADVYVSLQLRYEERARYLRQGEVDSWAVPESESRRRAIANLVALSREVRIEPVSDRALRVRQGDGLDAARLLLPDLARRLARIDATKSWLAAVPHRDALLLAGEDAMKELAALAENAARRAPHSISTALFELTPDGPRPL